jgi:hypothetical protein
MLLAVLVLLALVCAVLLCRRDTWIWPAVLVLLCGVWLLVDKPVEGPVLVGISRGHGITLSDLLAPAGVAFAAAVLYRRGLRHRAKPIPHQPTPNQPARDHLSPTED